MNLYSYTFYAEQQLQYGIVVAKDKEDATQTIKNSYFWIKEDFKIKFEHECNCTTPYVLQNWQEH